MVTALFCDCDCDCDRATIMVTALFCDFDCDCDCDCDCAQHLRPQPRAAAPRVQLKLLGYHQPVEANHALPAYPGRPPIGHRPFRVRPQPLRQGPGSRAQGKVPETGGAAAAEENERALLRGVGAVPSGDAAHAGACTEPTFGHNLWVLYVATLILFGKRGEI
eukprot:1195573-Prorocentrum_minimum.AAC.4